MGKNEWIWIAIGIGILWYISKNPRVFAFGNELYLGLPGIMPRMKIDTPREPVYYFSDFGRDYRNRPCTQMDPC